MKKRLEIAAFVLAVVVAIAVGVALAPLVFVVAVIHYAGQIRRHGKVYDDIVEGMNVAVMLLLCFVIMVGGYFGLIPVVFIAMVTFLCFGHFVVLTWFE